MLDWNLPHWKELRTLQTLLVPVTFLVLATFLDPFLGGSACGGDCVHHQNHLALHGSTSEGE